MSFFTGMGAWTCDECGKKTNPDAIKLAMVAGAMFVLLLILGVENSIMKGSHSRRSSTEPVEEEFPVSESPVTTVPSVPLMLPSVSDPVVGRVIPGLLPVDVYGNFKDRPGFVYKQANFASGNCEWNCKDEEREYLMDVTVFGSTKGVTAVEGLFQNYLFLEEETGIRSSEFLGYLATVSYEGSQAVAAKNWVIANINQSGAKTKIGGVSYEIFATAPRTRMLRISMDAIDAAELTPDLRPEISESAKSEPEPEPEPEPVETASEPSLPPSKFPPRTWTDASGKFTVEAVFVSRAMDKIKIRRTDNGKEIVLSVDQLSEEDQKYIKSLR